jgi:C4-dicarboxylate-specific signal transduction histidine kinase
LTRGRIVLKKEHVELSAVVGLALETVRPVIDAGGQKLTVTLPKKPVFLNADLTRLGQVLSN